MGETPEPLKRRLGRKAAEMEKWSFLQRRVVKLRTTAGKKHEESASQRGAEEGLFLSPSSGSGSAGIIETSAESVESGFIHRGRFCRSIWIGSPPHLVTLVLLVEKRCTSFTL